MMKSNRYTELEANQEMTPLADFMESYNNSVPESLPRASVKTLKKFSETFPSLFGNANSWSIDKHRKRFMDWLSSHQNDA